MMMTAALVFEAVSVALVEVLAVVAVGVDVADSVLERMGYHHPRIHAGRTSPS